MDDRVGAKLLKQPRYQKWIFAGLLTRLLVMPFSTHSDLLSVYHRAHLLLDGRPIKGLGPSLFSVIHAGFLVLIRPLIPYAAMWGDSKLKTYQMLDWLGFVNRPFIFRSLFLFKLPYLGVEILAVWMLLKLTEPDRRERVLAFWMLNPVVIFSTYIFGRFDMVTVWLLLCALYLAKTGRHNWSLTVLGVAALIRVYPIILVLPFALILESKGAHRARLAVIGFLPLMSSMVVGLVQGETGPIKGFAAMQHLSYPLTMKFYLFAEDNLYVFVFLYSLLMMFLYINFEPGFAALKKNCFYVLLLFFATSFFHPHYLLWLIPFVAFYYGSKQFKFIYWLQIGAWALYTFQWGRSLAGYLFAPLSPAFFWSVLSPSEWINSFYPAVQVIGIGRSVFSATCVVMAYLVWRRQRETAATEPGLFEPVKEGDMQ